MMPAHTGIAWPRTVLLALALAMLAAGLIVALVAPSSAAIYLAEPIH